MRNSTSYLERVGLVAESAIGLPLATFCEPFGDARHACSLMSSILGRISAGEDTLHTLMQDDHNLESICGLTRFSIRRLLQTANLISDLVQNIPLCTMRKYKVVFVNLKGEHIEGRSALNLIQLSSVAILRLEEYRRG